MDHVAIMKKSWRLIEKILSGEKTIESRWYGSRRAPLAAVGKGDTVYFKNSGERVTIRATVEDVLFFDDLSPRKVKILLEKYGAAIGIEKEQTDRFFELFKDKKYCMLVFLEQPRKIPPFAIDKKGFGAMAAWITVPSIGRIRTSF